MDTQKIRSKGKGKEKDAGKVNGEGRGRIGYTGEEKADAESGLESKLVGALRTASLCMVADDGKEALQPATDAPYPIACQAGCKAHHRLMILHKKQDEAGNEGKVSRKYFCTHIGPVEDGEMQDKTRHEPHKKRHEEHGMEVSRHLGTQGKGNGKEQHGKAPAGREPEAVERDLLRLQRRAERKVDAGYQIDGNEGTEDGEELEVLPQLRLQGKDAEGGAKCQCQTAGPEIDEAGKVAPLADCNINQDGAAQGDMEESKGASLDKAEQTDKGKGEMEGGKQTDDNQDHDAPHTDILTPVSVKKIAAERTRNEETDTEEHHQPARRLHRHPFLHLHQEGPKGHQHIHEGADNQVDEDNAPEVQGT